MAADRVGCKTRSVNLVSGVTHRGPPRHAARFGHHSGSLHTMTLVHRYMAKRLCAVSILAILGLCGPVTLVSTYNHLSGVAIYSELVWPALYGIVPMIFYHTMPVAVAVAITWCYGNFYSEFTLTALQADSIYSLSTRAPAFLVALSAAAIGYVISCFVAPNGVRHLQDVLNVIQHVPNPSL